VFTTPLAWMLYQRYIPEVRAALTPEEARALRNEGRTLPVQDALEEVARWAGE
jgi:hypothetical protein